MDISKQNKLELLAPAGSLESFFAAVENGADAIFCGLEQFSARVKAKNFSLQDLELIIGYAAKQGVKVYVALNTLLQEMELPLVINLLEVLEYLKVDAIIIQDFGLYQIARTHFPAIPLHASTQMLTHNLAGVLMLERLGFSRVVLARELTLHEISAIHTACSIEIEHFIHGAMCYSMSGHCLFSSYIDGRSGNRGRCIQPCRRRYHHKGQPGFHYSTSDFSSIELIPELKKAGVSSFKIEGRMKSAEYVASVVAAYRMIIDSKSQDRKELIRFAQEKLSQAAGRSSSHGFLKGVDNKNLVRPKQKGGLGRIIGKVQYIRKYEISFTTSDVLHVGDRIRVQPDNDRAGSGFTVRSLKVNNQAVKRARKNSFVTLGIGKTIYPGSGDLIFKLSSGKSFTKSKEACRRRLNAAPVRSHGVELTIHCADNSLVVAAELNGICFKRTYPVEMFPAKRSPLNREALQNVFTKTTNPVLTLSSLNTQKLPPVVIKPSRLKEIRRDFYKLLFKEFVEEQNMCRARRVAAIQSSIQGNDKLTKKIEKTERLFVSSDAINDLDAVNDYTDITFQLPLTADMLNSVLKKAIHQKRIIWELPSICFDGEWAALQAIVLCAIEAGFLQFSVNSLAHVKLFNGHYEVLLIGGKWLYTLNSQAMEAASGLNIKQWSLSIEDDRENIKNLLGNRDTDKLLMTVYSPVDLFTSRIKPAIAEHSFILENDKGGLLTLTQKGKMTVTQAEKPFSLLGKLQQLRKMGCVNFVLDLKGNGLLSEHGQEVLQAYYEDRTLAGTTLFNYTRGLS